MTIINFTSNYSLFTKKSFAFIGFFLLSFLVYNPLLAQLTVTLDTQEISCFEANDGSITATPSNGTTPYTYAWSSGEATQSISNLQPGNYEVTVTDADGNTVSDMAALTEPAPVLAIVTILSNVTCNGGFDGAASVVASGGAGFYTYNWEDGQLGTNATNLIAGTYTVTSTDAKGCSAINMVTITEPPAITLGSDITGVTCNGDDDGSIAITAADGVEPYTYNWASGETTSTLTGLSQGMYALTVTDANGCTVRDNYEIGNPTTIEVVTTITNEIACNGGNDAILSGVANGGQEPLDFQWSDGQMGRVASNISAGTYMLTVTDANGCSAVTTQEVTEPAPIILGVDKMDSSCGEASNGSITINPSGGTPDYQFAWSTGATTSSLSDLSAGSYTVTVTDANGCTSEDTIEIDNTGGEPIEAIAVPLLDVSCPGGFDGSASIIAVGGTPPFTYTWSNGQTGKNGTNLIGGTYTATATDANGCSVVREVTINEPAPIAVGVTKADISCNGGDDGSARVNVSGGTAPYSYAWSNGETGDAINNLEAGTYMVTVTDDNGCTTTRNVDISEPDPVTVDVEVVDDPNDPNNPNDPCSGSTGLATATGSGGTPPYSFAWSTGAETETVSGLSPGTYTVTITDAFGCTAEKTVDIQSFPALMISASGTDVSCSGANDGTASVTVSNGATPYTYAWSNGATTADISDLAGGTYEVTVTDKNGCDKVTSVTISESSSITIADMVSDVTCNGEADGNIFITPSGGTEPYTYAWSDGSTTEDRMGVAAGSYELTVTDSKGCSANNTFTINEPSPINVSTLLQVTGTGGTGGTGGCGDGSAAIMANATGGTPGYSYLWSNGETTQTIEDLEPGTYTVTVTDQNGCTGTSTAVVEEFSNPTVAVGKTDIKCFGEMNGTATATVADGIEPINYMWSNGATTQEITGLAAGTYWVTIEDAKGCTAISELVTIVEPEMFKIDFAEAEPICHGESTGRALAQGWGGTPPFTYLWDDGSTDAERTDLAAGSYSVTVTDNNGCIADGTVTIEEKDPITISFEDVLVGTGPDATTSVTATPSGGNGNYTYLWSDGQTTQTATGLAPGTYTVTVTDENGCTGVGTVVVDPPPSVTIIKQDVTCFGFANGMATAEGTGGTPPLTYLWSNGETSVKINDLAPGTYTVTVTDSKGRTAEATTTIVEPFMFKIDFAKADVTCHGDSDGSALAQGWGGTPPFTYLWSTGETTEEIKNLSAGTYGATVTDANGCVATGEVMVNEPDPITVAFDVEDVGCVPNATTSATANAAGGNGGYAYQWSNGQTTQTATGLAAGTYSVTVTDMKGCTGEGTVVVNISQPPSVSINKQDVLCFEDANGMATTVVSGGVAPLTYQWSNGATTSQISNLGPGTYGVTVTDSKGCSDEAEVTITEPFLFKIDFAQADAICHGDASGSALAQGWGGTPPFTYLWSTGETTEEIKNLAVGTYSVTVTDANGCVATGEVTIGQPDPITVTFETGDATCDDVPTSSVKAIAAGGNNDYAVYQWSDGQTTQTAVGLANGTYTVTVTDINGCTGEGMIELNNTPPPSVSISKQDVSCNGDSDGSATATGSGGKAPYTYAWSNGATTATISGLAAGDYNVTVTDARGCSREAQVTIGQPGMLSQTTSQVDVMCHGDASGSATVNASGGTAPYTYNWSNGGTTATISGLTAGTYTVTVSDAHGCVTTAQVVITQASPLTASLSSASATCEAVPSTSVTANASGGTGTYTYAWSDGQTTQTAVGLTSGTYSVTVTDAKGCSTVESITLNLTPAPMVSISSSDANCYHGADGSATATVTKGTGPYTYAWSNGATTSTISGLAPGTYMVTVTDARGCTVVGTVTIEEAQTLPSIKGIAWGDADRDGLEGAYESGVNGVMVDLLTAGSDGKFCTADDVVVQSQTTGNDGLYQFKCLPSGKYLVRFAMIPEGYQFTDQGQGNGTNDSDADPTDGKTRVLTLTDKDICDIDAGIYRTCVDLEDGGNIAADQEICRGTTPNTLTGDVPSNFGEMEYLWMYNNENVPFSPTSWSAIPGSNSQNYSPGELFATTYYVRCVRRKGCEAYIESNIIRVGVVDCRSAFIDFNAQSTKDNVQLNWKTVPEVQEAFYQVESSKDGKRFESIAMIEGKGNPTEITSYQYEVSNANAGINHYRIRRVEFGKEPMLSEVRKVNIATDRALMVYPNPFYTEAMIESASTFEAGSWIRIVNSKGMVVRQERLPVGEIQFKLSLNDEPSGMYFIQIVRQDGSVDAHKIQKLD